MAPTPRRTRGRPSTQPARGPEVICVICGECGNERGDWSLVEKGLPSVISASEARGDGLHLQLDNVDSVWLHQRCRADYVVEKNTERYRREIAKENADAGRALRSQSPGFDVLRDCLLCGEVADVQRDKKFRKNWEKNNVHFVQTKDKFEEGIRAAIEARGGKDESWAREVLDRMDRILVDFPAAEVRYHQKCNTKFRTLRPPISVQNVGRPVGTIDADKDATFQRLVAHPEQQDECQYSFKELEDIIQELGGGKTYSRKWLKVKLEEHYSKAISITGGTGENALINFTGFAEQLLYKNWYNERRDNEKDEKMRIITQAAKFIVEDLRTMPCPMTVYSTPEEIIKSQLPESLKCLMETIITTKSSSEASSKRVERRRNAIGQAIMYSCRPKSFLPPILLALGADIHHHEACRDMIDILHSNGLCVSYAEVRHFRYNLKISAGEEPLVGVQPYSQYVFDNADWNTGTLTGHQSVHWLAGVRIETPAPNKPWVPIRRHRLPPANLMAENGGYGIPPQWYTKPAVSGLRNIEVKEINSTALSLLHRPAFVTAASTMDSLWMCGRWLGVPRAPSWQGYMKQAMSVVGTFSGEKSAVSVLPFIDMPPSNLTTLYTALVFAARDCTKRQQDRCLVTFDQPLYSKAVEIVASDTSGELKGVTVRLGGFHLIMSFMSAITFIMGGSGLEDVWAQVYAPNTVKHMMEGGQYSRLLRALCLAQEAVGVLLLDATTSLGRADTAALRELHQNFLNNKVTAEEVSNGPIPRKLRASLEECGERVAQRSRTGKLWWLFFRLVGLLRLYIRAERTEDWELHLECVRAMLPIFHAAGRVHYARAAHLYVQQMDELDGSLEEAARAGRFTARRTVDFWACVWPDMIIEQDVMRRLKISGGFMVDRGMTENVISDWVMVMPAMLHITAALEQLSGIRRATSEQHKELRYSRQKTDGLHLMKFVDWLRGHSPFRDTDGLHCISTGKHGPADRNCDQAQEVGLSLLARTYGKTFGSLVVEKKGRVKNLISPGAKAKASRQDAEEVNTNLLFMRMCSLGITQDKLKQYLQFELTDKPPALFDNGLMRHNNKATLTRRFDCEPGDLEESLEELGIDCTAPYTAGTSPDHQVQKTVVDGGYLMHVVTWPSAREDPVRYKGVCQAYVRYVKDNFKGEVVVVFDGYEVCWSTKCEEQRRRAKRQKQCPNIDLDDDTVVCVHKEDFLSNTKNKTGLIQLLTLHLRAAGVEVVQAQADADVLVVETALRLDAPGRRVSVIASDTDIVVALMARAPDTTAITVVRPSNSTTAERSFDINALRQAKGEMVQCALVAHAMTGCDTRSAIFRKGKEKLWKNLEASEELRNTAREFNKPETEIDKDRIAECGEKLILSLYPTSRNGAVTSLDKLRYFEFFNKVTKNERPSVLPNLADFPPTSDAARQHSFRVYLQVQQWLGNSPIPTEWGWKTGAGTLEPVATLLKPAPAELLKLISCNCKSGCKANTNCSCRAGGPVVFTGLRLLQGRDLHQHGARR